ncbi:hypothetical protein M433DRAFT_160420 [Acidomyces richmondensis BFW]|nr:hypothetical protein M433DRAFT_160420 [Acidomyces richmondensis BFW]
MSLKLKIGRQPNADGDPPQPAATAATAATVSPSPSITLAGGPKLKLNFSQVPAPVVEQQAQAAIVTTGALKKPTQRKAENGSGCSAGGKKRSATEDISPVPKKPVTARKPSLMLKMHSGPQPGHERGNPTNVNSQKIRLGGPRKPSQQIKKLSISTANVKRPVPPRPLGVGYDSEDSEREEDPAIQQGLILRMQPGEDADLLRTAIAEGKIGVKEAGGLDVSLKFITSDQRRAVVRIQDRKYAAALVDLPCIIESMKSWDKKGWWKVADIHQMLLVLGPISSDEEAKSVPLPREVDKNTMQYPHGITPPMHYVRKRRFRKRANYKQMENVEEEVERLLREDDEWEKNNPVANISMKEYTRTEWEHEQQYGSEPDQQYDIDMDADGDVVDTTEVYGEQGYFDQEDEDIDTAGLEGDLALAFAEDVGNGNGPAASNLAGDSSALTGTQAASFSAVETPMAQGFAAETPAATPIGTPGGNAQEEGSSEEDESDYDEDEDELDVLDEDAAAQAAEKAQQLEEVADLEREIAAARAKTNTMSNQLLKKRELEKLSKLEEDLRMKRRAFGLETED